MFILAEHLQLLAVSQQLRCNCLSQSWPHGQKNYVVYRIPKNSGRNTLRDTCFVTLASFVIWMHPLFSPYNNFRCILVCRCFGFNVYGDLHADMLLPVSSSDPNTERHSGSTQFPSTLWVPLSSNLFSWITPRTIHTSKLICEVCCQVDWTYSLVMNIMMSYYLWCHCQSVLLTQQTVWHRGSAELLRTAGL